MFSERIVEALVDTQPIALVGDATRNEVYRMAAKLGFQIANLKIKDGFAIEKAHPLCTPKSACHWLFMIEGAEDLDIERENALLDLLFDGSPDLPKNTLVAAHFARACSLSEALSDPDVPAHYLELDPSEKAETIIEVTPRSIKTTDITRTKPDDLRDVARAA